MGKKKGQVPKSYEQGKLDQYQFQNLPPEKRSEMARKSAETRKKKKEEKMMLQNCMKTLLNLRISSDKQKQVLKQMGVDDKELTNKTLLMTALFKKGLTGDVSAIKEIIDMMEKLELFDSGKDVRTQPVYINLVPVGEKTEITEKDEQDIWKAENGIPLTEQKQIDIWEVETESDDETWNDFDDDSEWGSEVYKG